MRTENVLTNPAWYGFSCWILPSHCDLFLCRTVIVQERMEHARFEPVPINLLEYQMKLLTSDRNMAKYEQMDDNVSPSCFRVMCS